MTQIDIQGHRGCRGLFPENTIPAFLHALELGVNTLELDVVISKDNQVIVSHEPFFSHQITTLPNGNSLSKAQENEHNLFALSYEEIKTYDTGLKYNKSFPDQKKIKVHKPALSDLVKAVNEKLKAMDLRSTNYNIEIKYKAKWDSNFHPTREDFADLVIQEVQKLGIAETTTIQCFDIETLKYIREKYPSVSLVFLVDNLKPFKFNFNKLGFFPEIYSPNYKLVNARLVDFCQENKVKLIPWTVNEKADMSKLINLGVDGIITDYPDRLISLVE